MQYEDYRVTSCLLIIDSLLIQPPAETTPRQPGNFEQPQNFFPECGPFFATRSTISLPHLGHARATSDRACMFPLCWTEAIICVSLGPSIKAIEFALANFADFEMSA